jgi:hypothetical protein
MKIGLLLILTALFFTTDALAQRSGQSMTVQTGVVIAAQAVNLQSAAGRGAAAACGSIVRRAQYRHPAR